MKKNNNLLYSITILLILGFLATSLSSFLVSRKSLRAEIRTNTLPLTSDNIYSEIQRDLLSPVFISSLMASDTFLRDWILTGEENHNRVVKYLREIQKKYNAFTAFLVSEKTKKYYHTGGILKKISEQEPRDKWYFRVRSMNEEYEINVDPDMANKDAMTIFVNYRVYGYAGEYIGATGIGLNVNAVKALLGNYQQKYNRSIIFIDETGDVKLAGSAIATTLKNIRQRNEFPSFTKESIGNNGYFQYHDKGQLIHLNIRYIPEFDWYLLVEQKDSMATTRLWNTLLVNLTLCLIITFIVVVLVSFTISRYQQSVDTLKGIVPICSYCKQIRDDSGYWNQVEAYMAKHTEAEFSHGICPTCLEDQFTHLDIKG